MYCIINYSNGNIEKMDLELSHNTVSIPKNLDYQKISYIDFYTDEVVAREGDEGYFVFPSGQIGYFRGKKNIESEFRFNALPIYGIKTRDKCFVAILKGMRYDAKLIAGAKEDKYYCFIRYIIDEEMPYEDIIIEFHNLHGKDANYSGMARTYRQYQLSRGACVPIKDRLNEILKYTKDSVYVRIRQGWKPVPPTVLEQTEENEPEMKVACTFKDVKKLMEEFKRQGIDKAEFCLVGWNYRGHDGRYPQLFPVEPDLGGEEGLKELIVKAKELGYKLVCHTNSTDAYTIADCWSEDLIIKDKNGKLSINNVAWSGGKMYHLCPKKAYELALNDLPKVAELGFQGTHYIDVISIVPPRKCYDKNHPLNRNEAISYNLKILDLAKQLFGGISSEGGFDFAAGNLDYALYVSFLDPFKIDENSMADKCIPLWQLVCHGIVLSNPFTVTVNAPKKGMKVVLKAIEYGARPTIYYYSKFVTENSGRQNWMRNVDFVCNTEQDLKESVNLIKKMYDEYQKLSYLQTEFMESHEEIEENVFEITYSDGSKIIVDYNENKYYRK